MSDLDSLVLQTSHSTNKAKTSLLKNIPSCDLTLFILHNN